MKCNPCECIIKEGELKAWCPRHKMWKNKHWIHLCHTKPGYRKAWDEGRGPGQIFPDGPKAFLFKESIKPVGPGIYLSKMLGCSAKKWPHYKKMDELGSDCNNHKTELAKSLVDEGYVPNQSLAERFIQQAISQFENTKSK
jgi:hypothetical protein